MHSEARRHRHPYDASAIQSTDAAAHTAHTPGLPLQVPNQPQVTIRSIGDAARLQSPDLRIQKDGAFLISDSQAFFLLTVRDSFCLQHGYTPGLEPGSDLPKITG